jgi:hypothetical protein
LAVNAFVINNQRKRVYIIMQNEITTVVLKEGFLGNVYASGDSMAKQIYLGRERRLYRAYPVTSDTVKSFTTLAPLKNEISVGLFDELELRRPRIFPLKNSIGKGNERITYYENAILEWPCESSTVVGHW